MTNSLCNTEFDIFYVIYKSVDIYREFWHQKFQQKELIILPSQNYSLISEIHVVDTET